MKWMDRLVLSTVLLTLLPSTTVNHDEGLDIP